MCCKLSCQSDNAGIVNIVLKSFFLVTIIRILNVSFLFQSFIENKNDNINTKLPDKCKISFAMLDFCQRNKHLNLCVHAYSHLTMAVGLSLENDRGDMAHHVLQNN